MKVSQPGRMLSVAMLVLGLGGAIYSALEWTHAPSSSSLKYEVLFVMWLVLGIGWGSRLLSNGPGELRNAGEREHGSHPEIKR